MKVIACVVVDLLCGQYALFVDVLKQKTRVHALLPGDEAKEQQWTEALVLSSRTSMCYQPVFSQC